MPLIVNNNIELDIERSQVPLTFSVADMKSPEKRRSSTSKTITLIGTSRVMRFLQVIYNLSANDIANSNLQFSFDPRTRIEAQYIKDGVVLFDGLMQVTKAIKSNDSYKFEAVLFSNVLNIVKELEATTIDSLGWGEYDHDLGQQVIRDSWSDSVVFNGTPTNNFTAGIPDGFGYIYSWFDLGLSYRNSDGNPRFQRTSDMIVGVYWREILQKCMEYVGVDYNFTLNDTELFKRMVLFNEGGAPRELTPQEIQAREVEKDDIINYSRSVQGSQQYNETLFLSSFFDATITANQNTVNNGRITINQAGKYSIAFIGNLLLSVTASAGATQIVQGTSLVTVSLTVNGQPIDFIAQQFMPLVSPTKQLEPFNIAYQNEFDFNQGDEIDIRIISQQNYQNVLAGATVEVFIESATSTVQTTKLEAIETQLEDGNLIQIARHLPNQSAAEWYKGFMRLFNLYQVQQGDEVLLIPAQDFYSSTNDYEDWTEKLDHSEDIEIEPPNRIEGKFYNAKWSDEDDHYNRIYRDEFAEGYGNNIFDIGNTWQVGTVDLEVPFAQSVPVLVENTQNVFMPAIYRINEDNEAEPIKGNKPRLFVYNGLVQITEPQQCQVHPSDDSVPWNPLFITEGSDWVLPCFHHTLDPLNPQFDLNFKFPLRKYDGLTLGTTDNLWTRYWRTFIEEITSADAKILTAYFKLTKNDIRNLNFDKLKNINGVLYRLNIVKDYISENNITTQCELIKVIRAASPSTFVINLAPSIVPPNQNIINAVGGSIASSFTVYLAQNGFTIEPNMVTFLINQLVNSGTYNDYKLIMFPQAYKINELFAQVPLTANFSVTRTSTATMVNAQGVLEIMSNNIPRFDYSGGSIVPTLLVEDSDTNELLHSQELDNAYWTKTRLNTSGTPHWVDVAIAPDGTQTAEKLIANTDNDTHVLTNTIAATNEFKVFSAFCKADELTQVRLIIRGDSMFANRVELRFDLLNGVVLSSGQFGTFSQVQINTKFCGNGWYCLQLGGFIPVSETNIRIQVFLEKGGTATFAGDDIEGLFAWGLQLTDNFGSYIPTTTAPVTRAADVMTVNPPAGVTEIFEEEEGGAINVETTIPSTYTIPFGRWRSIKMK